MSGYRKKDMARAAADKVHLRNGKAVAENQNQGHNTQKEAMGPNTKR